MEELAKQIADIILKKLEPEIHKAMVEKIVTVACERWRFQFSSAPEIERIIDQGIEKAISEKYKPVLEYIADKKAREKALRRAEQNGMLAEVKTLFDI
jgi:hypothetical protein